MSKRGVSQVAYKLNICFSKEYWHLGVKSYILVVYNHMWLFERISPIQPWNIRFLLIDVLMNLITRFNVIFFLDILTLLPEAVYRRPCPNFPIKMTSTFHIPITLKDLPKMPIKSYYSLHHLLTNILHVFLIIESDFQKSEWFSTWNLSKHINLCYLYTWLKK